MPRVLITGANGFLGQNLQMHLRERPEIDLVCYTRNDVPDTLPQLVKGIDVVFHLAGANRPNDPSEFLVDNVDLTRTLAEALQRELKNTGKPISVVLASSTQAALDNPYGTSKRKAESVLFDLAPSGADLHIFRLPNVFGKWCRPNYNSVVATFCHKIARDQPIEVNDPAAPLTLLYIDDLMARFIEIVDGRSAAPLGSHFADVGPTYSTTVGALAEQLLTFRKSRDTLIVGRVGEGLTRALYATYLSHLPLDEFTYSVPQHSDSRGVFVEFLKTPDAGQFSFFTANPGMTRGGHYHHSKSEKFLVIKGEALFRFRHVYTGDTHEIHISGENPQIVETVPGWAHDIKNTGQDEMIVMLWATEIFNHDTPDTIKCPV